MNSIRLMFSLFVIAFLSGCMTTKSYVDPTYGKTAYSDIKSVATPYNSNVSVEFRRNGTHFARADSELRGHVERTLRASGVVVPGAAGANYSIRVIVNNVGDVSGAAAKGFATGLTLGAAGSLVTDYYEATIELVDADGNPHSGSYKHALHTTIGNKRAPFNMQPTTPADAFGRVVEQTVLNFIKEMQEQGLLSFCEPVLPARA